MSPSILSRSSTVVNLYYAGDAYSMQGSQRGCCCYHVDLLVLGGRESQAFSERGWNMNSSSYYSKLRHCHLASDCQCKTDATFLICCGGITYFLPRAKVDFYGGYTFYWCSWFGGLLCSYVAVRLPIAVTALSITFRGNAFTICLVHGIKLFESFSHFVHSVTEYCPMAARNILL